MSSRPPRIVPAAAGLLLAACSFDWGSLDPRLGEEPGTGGSQTTTTATSGGAGGSDGGGTASAGGQGDGPTVICQAFCVAFFECLSMGAGGFGAGEGIPGDPDRICQQECAVVAQCTASALQDLLECFEMLESCDDLMTVEGCLNASPCG